MGACANAPMVAINDGYFEDLTPKTLAGVIGEFAAGNSPAPSSLNGRRGCEPEGGPLTLTDPALYDGSRAQPLKGLPNMPETVS
jgi:NADH-quinone oxidoreductase subunit E